MVFSFRRRETAAAEVRPGVHVDAAALARLEHEIHDFHFRPRQPVHSLLAGRHASKLRGRGLEFEELRPYLPGDDIRTMDWRVTARTGSPHVRVYTEEKDRPVLLVVDQRQNMFFGSQRAMKSVVAAETAALVAWRVFADGDRVGGIVFDDQHTTEIKPKRNRDTVLNLLAETARRNLALRADAPPHRGATQLDLVLERVARIAHHDHLIVVISDFDGHSPLTHDLLLRLSAHNDVLTMLVHDPFLGNLPSSGEMVVSDGELQVELGFGRAQQRQGISSFVEAHGHALQTWQQGIGVPVLPLSAAEETAPQLRRLLGRLEAPNRRGTR